MIGETLGSFRIVSQLGRGGMGVIYQAEHQIIGKRAAIKVLRPELSRDREVIGRFFNEAKAVTAIEHPGLVDIYDFGYTADGSAYIVMELLAGESLGQRLARERAIAIDPAIAIARQLCGVLAATHAQGIVHRDLKPDNIFLTPDSDVAFGVRAKVLDFGIAKLAPGLGGLGTPETQTGMLLGTPMYMSPEQCRGGGHVDHRSDIYSLGVMFFEMVCGQTPFTGIGIGEVIAKHQYVQAPPPHTLAPAVPPRIDALITRMLGKAPQDRPQSMSEVLVILDGTAPPPIAIGTQQTAGYAPTLTPHEVPSPTAPSPGAAPLTVPPKRRRALYAVAAIAAIGASGIAAVALRSSRREPEAHLPVLELLPEDTAFVMALDAARLVQTPLWRAEGPKLIAALERDDHEHNIEHLRTQCDLDPPRDVHWFAFAYPTTATSPSEGAFLIEAAWDRDKLDRCLTLLGPDFATRPQPAELAGTPIRQFGDAYIAWLGPHVAAIATEHRGLAYLRTLTAHVRGSGQPLLVSQAAAIDHDAVLWLAGNSPMGLRPDTLPLGLLDQATTASLSITLGDELDAHLAVLSSLTHAADVQHRLSEELAQARPHAAFVDQIHVGVRDNTLSIDAHFDAANLAAVEALMDAIIAQAK